MISFKDFLSESLSGKDSSPESPDWDSIKKRFSPADGFEEAFWILPDGSLLGMDGGMHSDITLYSGPGRKFNSQEDFMSAGAIRICSTPENPILELRVPPTKEQMGVLYDWANYVKDSRDQILVSFDFSEYDSVDPDEAGRIPGMVRRKFGSTLVEKENTEETENGDSEKDNLSEEKVFAKEDEGGAPSGGDSGSSSDGGSVVAPSGGNPDPGVVSPEIDPGLDTQDVLGKCDHGKDGFFGPGCFHLPHNIFSVPCYRLPKKKKRRKDMGIQTLREDDGYVDFEKYAKGRIGQIVREINGNMLSRIDPELSVEYEEDYEFQDEKQDWVASLDIEGQTDSRTFPVGVNLPAIYDFLYENGLEMDNLETDLQLRAALYHETGHAIVRYLQDREIADMELGRMEEEKVVEEFAKYHLRKYTGQARSRLENVVWELFGERMAEKDRS